MTDFQLSDQTVEHAVERVGFLTWAVRDAQGQSMYISVSSHPDIYIYIYTHDLHANSPIYFL